MSGLSAAVELLNHGCEVTVLEAEDRFGGRIHTVRCGESPIELGAEFVHGRHRGLLNAISSARLSIQRVPDENAFFEKGILQPAPLWDIVGKVFDLAQPKQPDRTVSAFLGEQKLEARTHSMVRSFIEGFHAADTNEIGLHGLLKAEYSAERMQGASQARIRQSYLALVSYLEETIRHEGGRLLSGVEATRVTWKAGNASVEATRSETPETFEGDAVIITLPLGVLKARQIDFKPALPEKMEAINELRVGNVTKMSLVFREPWWPKRNFGFIHALDEPIPTWWDDPRGAVLTGWAGGPKAEPLLRHSPKALEMLCLETLNRIFRISITTLQAQLVQSYSYNWARSPHFRGAYSFIPVNGLHLPKLLAQPVERTLFFAGEATTSDAQMGTVFSAWESGIRAARECIEAFR